MGRATSSLVALRREPFDHVRDSVRVAVVVALVLADFRKPEAPKHGHRAHRSDRRQPPCALRPSEIFDRRIEATGHTDAAVVGST